MGLVPSCARRVSQDASRRNALFDGRRAGSRPVGSSRVSLRSDLGAERRRGPLQRDLQAGAVERPDRCVTGSILDPPEPPRRRETAGCSIVRPTGGNSSRTGGVCGIRKSPQARDAISSRANETRVLEIEAVDGRNRSYASRVWSIRRRKTMCVFCTLADNPPGNRLTRPKVKSFRRNDVRSVVVFN
jgi:hypothetical protein